MISRKEAVMESWGQIIGRFGIWRCGFREWGCEMHREVDVRSGGWARPLHLPRCVYIPNSGPKNRLCVRLSVDYGDPKGFLGEMTGHIWKRLKLQMSSNLGPIWRRTVSR